MRPAPEVSGALVPILLNGGFGYEDLRLSITVAVAATRPTKAISPRRVSIACLSAPIVEQAGGEAAAGRTTSHDPLAAKFLPPSSVAEERSD
jgi:hypothetical protein